MPRHQTILQLVRWFATTLERGVGRRARLVPTADGLGDVPNGWYPLYAYVRRKGYQVEEAKDLTQQFLPGCCKADGSRWPTPPVAGSDFLLTALNHFLINEWTKSGREETRRRGRVCHSTRRPGESLRRGTR
jgi:hypothetical protein